MNAVSLLRRTYKIFLVTFAVTTLSIGGLVFNAHQAQAQTNQPTMAVKTLVSEVEDSSAGWQSTLNTQGGRTVKFYVEIHNTQVGSQALKVKMKSTIAGGTATSFVVPTTVWADNAGAVGTSNTINVTNPPQGATFKYVPGTARLTWDENGDTILDYNQTPIPDSVISGDQYIADQSGCYEFVMQINFLAKLESVQVNPTPTPTPVVSPTPTPGTNPSPTPTPSTGGQEQKQKQEQTQNNNQTVNITNTTTAPAVAGIKEAPKTGPEVLGIATLMGAAPVGVALSRYGRGRLLAKKPEQTLEEIAQEAFTKRNLR